MRRIRSSDTSPEMIVRRVVHGMGFRYRLHVPTLPGKPDLVFPRLKKIVEVRGCFWHQHDSPTCKVAHSPRSNLEYWQGKLQRNKTRDAAHCEALKAAGWDVLVIWECEIKNGEGLAQRVHEFLEGGVSGGMCYGCQEL